ncbi:MAG: hypothetical protein CSA70_04605 [Rhodobacterales bacterium]|nr:MAG: hypothetical protein CSA70_04605 [Rhodobacterales bacterium]
MRKALMMFVALGMASPVSAFRAVNFNTVNPLNESGNFEVVLRAGDGPMQVWCAASDYASRVLRAGDHTRIYITEGLGHSQTAPGRKGVSFTVRPSKELANGPRPGDNGNYSVSYRKTGFNLSVVHAGQFCIDPDDDIWEFNRP